MLRDDLAEALWGENPPATWEKALGGIVSKLRVLLGECGLDGAEALTAAFGCYRLALPDGTWIDVAAAAEAGDASAAARAAHRLETAKAEARRAASLAAPPFLPGEEGAWVEGQRRKLADIRLHALECLAEACLQSGDPSDAARSAEEALALQPFRESNYRLLMQAHAAAGNTGEALRAYERCRRFLAEELGAYPSAQTEAVYRELLQAPAVPDTSHARAAPAAEVRPRWRRKRALAGGAVLAGAAAVLLTLLGTKGDSRPAGASLGANTVGVIDATNGRVVGEIDLGAAPGEIAVATDAVWITNPDDDSVVRIDPATSHVEQTIDVGGGPAGIAVGDGAVWVANGLDGTVSRIDPAANRVVQTIAVGNGPTGLAYGRGAVWVTNSADGTVTRIDPDSGRVTRTVPAAIGASGIAVAFGRVWVASPPLGSVTMLEPRSGRILRRIGVGVDPDALSAGPDAVWVANRADATLSRIDPRSGAVSDTIRVGRGPSGIAAGAESVWVANRDDGTLSRIDAATREARTVRVGSPPQGAALGSSGLYVTVRSSGSEHLGGTLRVLGADAVDSIDFALAPPWAWQVLTLTNDGLVGFRRVGGVRGAQLVPDLAVALPTPTDGGRTYTFEVRPGIRYYDGRLVQPDDFLRAFERLFEVGGLKHAYHYTGIVGADRCAQGRPCDLSRGIVTDRAARTVSFHLKAADPAFLAKLALPPAFAVPSGTPRRDVGAEPLPATGPYRIVGYRKDRPLLRLVRNPRFREWSRDAQPRGYPDSISWSWRLAGNASARVRAVEDGAADMATGGSAPLPRRELDVLAVRYANRLHVNPQLSTTLFFLNTRVPPFDDIRARRAVSYAFDQEAFAQRLGPGFTPACQILPPNFPGYSPTCPHSARGAAALDRARALVRSSGTAGAPVSVWVPAPIAVQGRLFASVLNAIGYRARLEAVAEVQYFGKVSDSRVRAQVGYYTWFAEYPSATDFIPPQLSCEAFVPASDQNANMSEFCDPQIDGEIALARDEQDAAAASVLWQRVERSLLAAAPVVPAYNRGHVDFVSERLGNYQYNPQWGLLLDEAWVR